MTIVITGVGGLLGRELAIHARALGHRVIGVARRWDPTLTALTDELVIEDLASSGGSRANWRSLAGDAVVFHLAASTLIYSNSEGLHQDSIRATITACDIARQTGNRMVFFSSSAVYSGHGTRYPVELLNENSPSDPGTAYGQAKKTSEAIIVQSGIPAIVLRIFGVLSIKLLTLPFRGNLVQAIARSLSTGAELKLGVDLQGKPTVRDYVLAGDACRLALLSGDILARGKIASRETVTLNLCTGIPTSTCEMARNAQSIFGKKFPISLEPRKSEENQIMVGDTSNLNHVLGSIPRSQVDGFWQQAAATELVPERQH